MAGRVSLKFIANKAGVSPSTASMILNNRANYCSDATRQRVRDVAAELGYQTHFGYQLMQGKKTRTVAIMYSSLETSVEEHLKSLQAKLIAEFDQRSYAAYSGVYGDDPQANLEKTRAFINRGVEGFVFLGEPKGTALIVEELEKLAIPHIGRTDLFQRHITQGVSLGPEAIFRYLISKVGLRFKMICQQRHVHASNTRMAALMNIFHPLTWDEILDRYVHVTANATVRDGNYAHAAWQVGHAATRELLEREPDLHAIAYTNDGLALGGGCFILQSGQDRHHQILLAGYNNTSAIQHFPLPITSVEHPSSTFAREMVTHLLADAPCQIDLSPTLHIRERDPNQPYPHWTTTTVCCKAFLKQVASQPIV